MKLGSTKKETIMYFIDLVNKNSFKVAYARLDCSIPIFNQVSQGINIIRTSRDNELR